MANIPLPIKPSPDARDRLRDYLIDELRTKTVDEIVDEHVSGMLKAKAGSGDYIQRRMWCLAQLHSRKDLRRMAYGCVASLGRAPFAIEPDPLTGAEDSVASLFDALFGITYVGTGGGGTDSLTGEEVGWGDDIGDHGFESEEDAQQFADEMEKADFPVAGPIYGPDGQYHVYVNEDGSN